MEKLRGLRVAPRLISRSRLPSPSRAPGSLSVLPFSAVSSSSPQALSSPARGSVLGIKKKREGKREGKQKGRRRKEDEPSKGGEGERSFRLARVLRGAPPLPCCCLCGDDWVIQVIQESETGHGFWPWRENMKPERLAPELQEGRLRLHESSSLTGLFLQVVTVLAMVWGTHIFSLQLHKDSSHQPSCCPSKRHDFSEEWLKWNPVVVTPPETANLIHHMESCQASEDGPLNSRAISPWRYELDRDLDRLPQDLYHARCLCPHCVSLETGTHMDPLGNSELLYHNQTVFYRRRCRREGGAHKGYCLERRLYRVSLACVCVRPRVMA
ncbi:interleukin-25 [Orycteropus afer afer]|uniref:Interleukin-25 n=1 Tax=Orycteropus afer afer TaxID=1230840 RepID=A0A8B7ANW1_ORYAF|nr:interleukin-25 [Orycteropus afer afer]